MPKPTLQNRNHFKQYLRYFKNRFDSDIQTVTLEQLRDMFGQEDTSLADNTDVKVLLFDNLGTVDISSAVSDNSLVYFPALPGDRLTVQISSKSYSFTFEGDEDGITYDGTTYNAINDSFTVGDRIFTIKGLGGVLVQSSPAPTYSIGVSTTRVNEGSSVDFTVNTTAVSAGTTVYYSTVAVSAGTTGADFGNSSLTGSFNIIGTGSTTGVATITRIIAADTLSENGESFRLQIREGSTSGTVVATSPTVRMDNVTSFYTVTPSAASVSEGSSVSFTVNTGGVNISQPLYYSTGGASVDSGDFSDGSLTGSFNIVSTGSTTGVGTITRSIATDFLTETSESFFIQVRTGSTSGSIVATSSTIDITDVVPTFSAAVSSTTVNEGGSITFTISGTNIPDGTYHRTIEGVSGTISSSDFSSSINDTFTISNNSGSFTITLADDLETEGEEKFKVRIRRDSATGTIVATSSDITINDTSRAVGANANGLTFGPVQVDRGGVTDWYAICDLDNVPDGSSIALFIDGSGSMTLATVQASYDLLVSKLNARGITITSVTNPNEDWITPFLVDLP
jgi:hypothetical protein